MANITLHEALIEEDVNDSRIKINENFDTIEDVINSLLTLLDTDTAELTGVKLLEIDASQSGASIVTFINNGSNDIKGNETIAGTLIVAGNTTLNANLTINTGSVTVNENVTIKKKNKSEGAIINTQAGMSSQVNVAALSADQSVSGMSFLALSWANYDSTDANFDTESVTLGAGIDVGQIVDIYVANVSTATPGPIMTISNTRFDSDLVPSNITLTEKGEYLRVVWTGANWRIINAHPRIYTNNPTLL